MKRNVSGSLSNIATNEIAYSLGRGYTFANT